MPLKKGKSPATVSKNARRMIDEGFAQRQALAIALANARESDKRKGNK
jgi:hypothetical protein